MANSGFRRASSHYENAQVLQRYLQEVGNDPSFVNEIAQNNSLPKDQFSKLQSLFYHLPPSIRKEISAPWHLLVISGSKEGFEYAVKHYHLDKNSRTVGGLNALHLAALSDNPEQVNRALALSIGLDSTSDTEKLNALEYAALSGNVAMINKIVELEKTLGITLKCKNVGPNMLMLAAASGKLPAYQEIEKLAQNSIRAANKDAQYENKFTVTDFAIKGNNHQIKRYLGIPANQSTDLKHGEVKVQNTLRPQSPK